MTGTLCLTVVYFSEDQYQPSQALIKKLQPFEFSKQTTQYHCPTCGTQMMARTLEENAPDSDGKWSVATGTFEQAEGVFQIRDHEFIADTIDGGFSDFLLTFKDKPVERWPGHYGEGEQLPPHWRSASQPKLTPSPSDRLHAHCKCGGINLWIARPSERSTMGRAAWPDVIIPFNSDEPHPPQGIWWLRDDHKKYLAGVCACNSCRLAVGMEWVEWAFVPTVDISLDAEGKVPFSREFGTLKHYRSSDVATRHFCDTCGATVFWDGDERPQLIDVAVGLLNAPEGARAESWLDWRSERLSYREDAAPRAESVTLGVEAGLKEYGKRKQGS